MDALRDQLPERGRDVVPPASAAHLSRPQGWFGCARGCRVRRGPRGQCGGSLSRRLGGRPVRHQGGADRGDARDGRAVSRVPPAAAGGGFHPGAPTARRRAGRVLARRKRTPRREHCACRARPRFRLHAVDQHGRDADRTRDRRLHRAVQPRCGVCSCRRPFGSRSGRAGHAAQRPRAEHGGDSDSPPAHRPQAPAPHPAGRGNRVHDWSLRHDLVAVPDLSRGDHFPGRSLICHVRAARNAAERIRGLAWRSIRRAPVHRRCADLHRLLCRPVSVHRFGAVADRTRPDRGHVHNLGPAQHDGGGQPPGRAGTVRPHAGRFPDRADRG